MKNHFFWEDNKVLDSSPFLITEEKILSYKEAFNNSDLIFKDAERDVLLILCKRNINTVLAYIGALRNGIVPLLVDSDIKQGSLLRIVEAYQPKYIFTSSDNENTASLPNEVETQFFNEGCLKTYAVSPKKLNPDLLLLLLTSGSTGDPKSVRISKSNLSTATKNIVNYLNLSVSSKSLALLPFHYSYGLSVLNNTIYTRSSILLTQKDVLDKTLWKDCISYGITDLSAVPFILELMARMKLPEDFYYSLKCMTQAGGRLNPKITKRFIEISQEYSFDYYTMYGQTEASPRISYVPPEKSLEKLGTVGRPIDCGEIYIDKIGNKKGEGELIYVGENVCMGYASRSHDLSLDDELNGELKTGDIAVIDEENFITIIGRKKRFIKLKGISVNLDYVESILNSHLIKSFVIGKDDKLLIVIENNKMSEHEDTVKNIIKDNFNFHSSLVSIYEDELTNLSSGKPDYKSLSDKYL